MKFLKFFVISLILFFSVKVYAANLGISPSLQNVNTGDIVSVSIMVSTSGQAINAVSGILNFPKNLLEVSSVSATGSIINFWANEPKFSNSAGTVNFEGVIMSPGFTGNNGRILKINFKAKSTGQANLQFDTASILANDGNGTDIISGKGSASIYIKEKILEKEKIEPVEEKIIPNVPIVITPQILPIVETKENAIPFEEKKIATNPIQTNAEISSDYFSFEDLYLIFSILGILTIILLIIIVRQRYQIKKLRILLEHYENRKKI